MKPEQVVYFDNSATTAVDPDVMTEMTPYFLQRYGNASSLHRYGMDAYEAMEHSRENVAKALGSSPKEILFTSGGTESDNLALQGFAFANRKKGGHIITSAIEHHAILHTCEFLEKEGFSVTYLPVGPEGIVSPDSLRNAMTDETILVSIMMANNEIGTIQPIRELAAVAHEKGALFHTDAVQSVGKMPIDVVRDGVDMLSLAAHKFHGPKGVGALYVKKGVQLRPLTYGGGHERGLRPSTENIPGIVGLGKAIELAISRMENDTARMRSIRDKLMNGALDIPDSFLNGHREKRLCNNVHVRYDFIEGESLVMHLDMAGFATSTGSACSSKSLEPSHVLTALGIRKERTHGSLRITLSRLNTQEEADRFLQVLPAVVGKLREMSPIKSWDDYEITGNEEEEECHTANE
ncbi:MAG: putative cysteine desulfurase 2 [Methanomassiliicoccales archaeon PtaU1.Bin124]|nr:MAG: putative cysteine desulfurase 2 [Methanomassiliicoccales archaeon PtaU1.Bin124]